MRTVAMLLFGLLLSGAFIVSAEEPATIYDRVIQSETCWLMSLQTPEGAIRMHEITPDAQTDRYNPYFACFAMMGLLETGQGQETVRKYLDFHFAHLNTLAVDGTLGTIYDYDINNATGELTPTYDYDSTDSYAAMMLQLLRCYAEMTGDMAYFQDKREKIDLLVSAMLCTLDDGLTYAKPSYPVKYLMDNCEVMQGHLAAAWMYELIYADPQLAAHHTDQAEQLKARIEETFWNPELGIYSSTITNEGPNQPDISVFYPDAVSQLFPIIYDMVDPRSQRAKDLYAKFIEHHADWTSLGQDDTYPWALLLRAAYEMGDIERVNGFLEAVYERFIQAGHPYPWYCAESGFALWAACKLKNIS